MWWVSRFFVLGLLLAVVVFFAPTLIANTGAWPYLLNLARGDRPYAIATGAPQLGWFSQVVIPKIEVRDAKGEVLATVEQVQTEKTLLSLALSPRQPGTITIQRPHVRVVLDGQPLTAQPPASSAPPAPAAASQPIGVSVRVSDGTVEIVDATNSKMWTFAGLNVAVDTPASDVDPLQFDVAVQTATQGGTQMGSVKAQGKIVLAPGKPPVGDVNVEAAGVDLSVIRPIARQFIGELATQGVLTTKAAVHLLDGGGVHVQLQHLSIPELAVASPKFLGNDTIVIRQLAGQGEVALNGQQIAAKQFTINSDTARIDADGVLHLRDTSAAGLFQALASGRADEPLQLAAQVDLARLARSLPSTVKLREGMAIQSGRIALQVERDPQAAVPRVTGSVRTSELVAVEGGRTIRWDEPISASFAVSQSAQGPQLEQLQCRAEFLQVDAAGTLTQGQATLQGDLNRLMAELDKVIDIPELKLAGALNGKLTWNHGVGDVWTAKAEARLQNFVVQAPNLQPWQEKDLQVSAELGGLVQNGTLARIDRGTAGVISGNDRLEAQLTKVVEAPSATSIWPVSWKVSGNLATWMPRLQPIAPVQKVRAEGEVTLEGSAAVSTTSVVVERAVLTGKQVRAMAGGVFIDEDELRLETTASWDGNGSRVIVPVTTFASSTLAFRVDQLNITYGAQGFSAAGQLDYRGNVERLAQLVEDPRKPPTSRVGGDLSGRVNLTFSQGVTEARFTSNINDLVYATPQERVAGVALASANVDGPWKVRWADKAIVLQGQLAYDSARDTLKISAADIQASQIRAAAGGTIAAVSTQPFIDLAGTLVYDLAEVVKQASQHESMQHMQKFFAELQVAGKEERPFSLRGPLTALSVTTGTPAAPMAQPNDGARKGLVSPDLFGQMSVGWQSIQYVGLTFGKADIQGKLEKGNLDFAPIDIPVSEGRMKATPHLLLNNDPPLAVLDRGPLLDHVQLSPELCRGWLKFVAPLIADATAAQGKFSVDLEGTMVPLFTPDKCDVAGALRIHDATIGPGPLASQLIGMTQQMRTVVDQKPFDTASSEGGTWMVIRDQQINFRVVEGRVHHRGMKIMIKDVELTTDGSVGFDQTLELVATVPVRDEWLKTEIAAAAFKGQKLTIPIGGTIARPQLDRRALEDLTKKMVRGAAKNLLDDQLQKGLKGLFGPKP